MTNPGYKKLVRIYDQITYKAVADLITLDHENISKDKPLELFDPLEPWKRMNVTGFYTKDLLIPIFKDGKQVYHSPSLLQIQQYCKDDLKTFWGEFKRLKNPEIYKVDLSRELYMLKMSLLNNINTL